MLRTPSTRKALRALRAILLRVPEVGDDEFLPDVTVTTSIQPPVTVASGDDAYPRVKRVAADRDTSVSALMTEALDRLADEDRRYSAARKRALAALKSARSLGTQGRRTWSRDELHERRAAARVR